jgi:hypothetical protein
MEYMFLLYSDGSEAFAGRDDMQDKIDRHTAIMTDATARGVFRAASPLRPVSTAVTVRAADGKVSVTDGPFVEAKEALGGFYLIDCKDDEDARYWASRLAETGCAMAVEFRALAWMPEVMQRAARGEPAAAVHA